VISRPNYFLGYTRHNSDSHPWGTAFSPTARSPARDVEV